MQTCFRIPARTHPSTLRPFLVNHNLSGCCCCVCVCFCRVCSDGVECRQYDSLEHCRRALHPCRAGADCPHQQPQPSLPGLPSATGAAMPSVASAAAASAASGIRVTVNSAVGGGASDLTIPSAQLYGWWQSAMTALGSAGSAAKLDVEESQQSFGLLAPQIALLQRVRHNALYSHIRLPPPAASSKK
jgi:hypothetical protein